nr:hypothetical protein BaRGS_032499 [Batillaria attramentaria]
MTVSSLYGSMAMSKPGELVRTLRNFERVIVGEKQRSKVLKASVRVEQSEQKAGSVFLYYCSPVLKSLMAKVVSSLEATRIRRMADIHVFNERAWWLVSILSQ